MFYNLLLSEELPKETYILGSIVNLVENYLEIKWSSIEGFYREPWKINLKTDTASLCSL